MPKVRQKIWFVAHSAATDRGSTLMRSSQLCRLIAPHLENNYELSVIEMPTRSFGGRQRQWIEARPKGGIYFLTKVAVERMPKVNALALQQKADGVCFDYVDTPMSSVNMAGADIHVCSSYSQFNAVRRRLHDQRFAAGKAMLLFHNADERLYDLDFMPLTQASAVYWALERNGFLPKSVRKRVSVLSVGSVQQAANSLPELPQHNLHYAIRNTTTRRHEVFKPFTRGFVAAICKSNIIALRTTDDVTEFLGEDYPYLCDTRTEEEVVDMLDRAQRGFGTPDWHRGLDRMRHMAGRIAPEALASQMRNIAMELGH